MATTLMIINPIGRRTTFQNVDLLPIEQVDALLQYLGNQPWSGDIDCPTGWFTRVGDLVLIVNGTTKTREGIRFGSVQDAELFYRELDDVYRFSYVRA